MINPNTKSITFCFPYFEVSGVPVLFYRLANAIEASEKGIKINIIDYSDGAMARNITKSSYLTLIPFEDDKKILVPENTILVLQTELPFCIKKELVIPDNVRLIFWTLHPNNLVLSVLPFPFLNNLQFRYFGIYRILVRPLRGHYLKKLKEFINLCLEHRAIWFMDQTTLDNTAKFLFTEIKSADFVPVMVSSSTGEQHRTVKHDLSDQINFCWVGRLCDWKSHILIYTIKQLSILSALYKMQVTYHIVGDGPYKSKIEELQESNEYFNVEIYGSMEPVELGNFLLGNIDIVTGMGTSALEGAKLGIPTLLLDYSHFPVEKDYKFRWLYETKNYDLGHEITDKDIVDNNDSLKNILVSFREMYDYHSKKSFEYFKNSHDIQVTLYKFLEKAEETTLNYSQIDPKVLNDSLLRKLYIKIRYHK